MFVSNYQGASTHKHNGFSSTIGEQAVRGIDPVMLGSSKHLHSVDPTFILFFSLFLELLLLLI
jgi:hypothetical protein